MMTVTPFPRRRPRRGPQDRPLADLSRSPFIGFAPFLVAACASTPTADPRPLPAHLPTVQADSGQIAYPPTSLAGTIPLEEPPDPAHATCAYWGTQAFFRQASPEDVDACLRAGADPNGPPGLYPLPPYSSRRE